MDLDDIPKDANWFPPGIIEVEYPTQGEAAAFTDGLEYAEDLDVRYGEIFERNGKFVVRVQTGEVDDGRR